MKLEDKLFLNRYKPDENSHVKVKDPEVCRKCETKPCTHICPAEVYKLEGEHIELSTEGCLECGACRIACPYDNLDWSYPRGEFGIQYKFG